MSWGRFIPCLNPERPFVALNLQTTGVKPDRHEIIEVAAIRLRPGQNHANYFHRLVRPTAQLAPRIVEMTGIDDALLRREGVSARTAIRELVGFIGGDPLVSYDPVLHFDFLNAACAAHGISAQSRGGHSCAMTLARKTWPGLPSYRLKDLAARLELAMGDAQRALGDARRAAQIYKAAALLHFARAA